MTAEICTGHGASDTHALVLSDGRTNPSASAGKPYQTLTAAQLFQMVQTPPTVAKELGQWIIPSSYHDHDARSHESQRAKGRYHYFCADIDKGSPDLATVKDAVRQVLGEVAFMVFSTRSATPDNRKWRVIVPLGQTLTGEEYGAYQAAWFDGLTHFGLTMDRTLERAGQLVYLPNRGAFYEWDVYDYDMLLPRAHPMAPRAMQYMEVQAAAEANASGQARNEGARSPLRAFRAKHSIESLLAAYGYERRGVTDHWRSPLSDSGSYSTQDRGDHWISLSHNDAAAGLGKATPNGSRYGDAFDLYTHYSCGGNAELAMTYARQCLVEADAARYGDATAEHGREVWESLMTVGDKLGPAGHRQEMMLSSQRAEALKTPDPEIVDEAHDWSTPWPPGIAGEIAKYIYRASSRPVKQFSIAMALYVLAGMAGQRYNVEGFGLNLYMAIVGDSGTGKGEARRGAKRVYGAFGHAAQDPQGVSEVYDHDFPASSAGLRKMFDGTNSTRAVYKEDADAVIESMTATVPGSNGDLLRAALSGFYDQSGAGLNMGAVRYAKAEDSSQMVSSPSLTLGFDLQVDPFKRFLGHGVVLTTGIGARFMYIVRYGKRMYAQKNRQTDLPSAMTEHLKTIWNGMRMQTQGVTDVRWQPEAKALFEKLDDDVTTRIRNGKDEEDLLNRAAMNSARVAACLAVGVNQIQPVITVELFQWAQDFVLKGYDECLKLMTSGEVGSGERVRVGRAVKAIQEYVKMTAGRRHISYRVPKGLDALDDILCERYFITRLAGLADFKGTDNGQTSEDLVRRTLAELVRQEYLVETNRADLAQQRSVILHASIRQPLYMVGPSFGG